VLTYKPARQPEAVAAGFEGKRNPRDRAPSPDRLIPPGMQHCNQPFWARLELLARVTLNTGKHAGDEPARLAQLDDGNDRGQTTLTEFAPKVRFASDSPLEEGRFKFQFHLERNSCRRALRAIAGVWI
jgi:hypothetical protein